METDGPGDHLSQGPIYFVTDPCLSVPEWVCQWIIHIADASGSQPLDRYLLIRLESVWIALGSFPGPLFFLGGRGKRGPG